MEDFPKASTVPPAEETREKTPEEYQFFTCSEAVKKITQTNHTVSVTLNTPLLESVRQKMEDNGFQVAYTLTYNSKATNKYNCVVKITDPALKEVAMKDVKQVFGSIGTAMNLDPASQRGFDMLVDMFTQPANVTSFNLH